MVYEVPESDARDSLARLYGNIRTELQVPVVNLIYRRLAAIGQLERVWSEIKLVLKNPRLEELRHSLFDEISQNTYPMPSIALELLWDNETTARAREVLVAFNRANSLNSILLNTLLRGSARDEIANSFGHSTHGARITAQPTAWKSPRSVSDMPVGVGKLVTLLANRISPERPNELMPTLLRQLAWWPEVLALLFVITEHRLPDISRDAERVERRVERIADELVVGPGTIAPEAVSVLREFRATVPRMLVFGTYCLQTLPDGATHDSL